jgi:RNA polymerase-binding transcription factor DksA
MITAIVYFIISALLNVFLTSNIIFPIFYSIPRLIKEKRRGNLKKKVPLLKYLWAPITNFLILIILLKIFPFTPVYIGVAISSFFVILKLFSKNQTDLNDDFNNAYSDYLKNAFSSYPNNLLEELNTSHFKDKKDSRYQTIPDENLRYSDAKLLEFKTIILEQKGNYEIELINLEKKALEAKSNKLNQDLADLDIQITIKKMFMITYNIALKKIEDKTYGICMKTGAQIPESLLKEKPLILFNENIPE